jgi:hypothetical protein
MTCVSGGKVGVRSCPNGMPRCEQFVERDSGVACTATAFVVGSRRPARRLVRSVML